VLQGNVKKQLVLDEVFLKSLPAVTIDVTFETGQGKKSGRCTGVLLWALLERAQPIDEPGQNTSLKHTLMITGRALISGEPKRFSWLRALELRIKPHSVRASVDA
jgi:hypothetical protein